MDREKKALFLLSFPSRSVEEEEREREGKSFGG